MKRPIKREMWIDNPEREMWIDNPEIIRLRQKMLDFIGELSNQKERFKFLDSGRHRSVFLHINKGYVIKIAKNLDGLQANDDELRLFKKGKGFPKARCRRLSEVAIVMEYVDVDGFSFCGGLIPEWAYSVDCGQVGINKSGKLVAYDYSII